jgi:hypothetical protein
MFSRIINKFILDYYLLNPLIISPCTHVFVPDYLLTFSSLRVNLDMDRIYLVFSLLQLFLLWFQIEEVKMGMMRETFVVLYDG